MRFAQRYSLQHYEFWKQLYVLQNWEIVVFTLGRTRRIAQVKSYGYEHKRNNIIISESKTVKVAHKLF